MNTETENKISFIIMPRMTSLKMHFRPRGRILRYEHRLRMYENFSFSISSNERCRRKRWEALYICYHVVAHGRLRDSCEHSGWAPGSVLAMRQS